MSTLQTMSMPRAGLGLCSDTEWMIGQHSARRQSTGVVVWGYVDFNRTPTGYYLARCFPRYVKHLLCSHTGPTWLSVYRDCTNFPIMWIPFLAEILQVFGSYPTKSHRYQTSTESVPNPSTPPETNVLALGLPHRPPTCISKTL